MNKTTLINAALTATSITLMTFGVSLAAYTGVYVGNKILGPLTVHNE